jgi:hypothetical protein
MTAREVYLALGNTQWASGARGPRSAEYTASAVLVPPMSPARRRPVRLGRTGEPGRAVSSEEVMISGM